MENLSKPEKEVRIAICGKYSALNDSYASINEALIHCSAHTNTRVIYDVLDVETESERLQEYDGIIIPGGFGDRGTEEKISCINYARKNKIPFLGICLGLQLAVIEFARSECGINATSEEFGGSGDKIISILDEQREVTQKGGTMRLGSYPAHLKKDSIIFSLYGSEVIEERHRHRFEVNPNYHRILEENGMILAGLSPDGKLVEFISLPDHPYFVGTQSHPELKSKLESPAPLFLGLIQAAIMKKYN